MDSPAAQPVPPASVPPVPVPVPPVLVPRPAGRGRHLLELLAGHGLTCEHRPFVGFEHAPARELAAELGKLARGEFSHLVVTSRTAVDALVAAAGATGAAGAAGAAAATGSTGAAGAALQVPASTLVVAVGPGTAEALREAGAHVDVVADGSGAAVVEALPTASGGERVWFPASSAAAPTVFEGLTAKGYQVLQRVAYRPRVLEQPAAVVAALREGHYSAVVLTSPMIAEAVAAIGVHPSTLLVAIGDPTRRAARSVGLRVDRQAAAPTDDDLAQAVAETLHRAQPFTDPTDCTGPTGPTGPTDRTDPTDCTDRTD